MLTAPKAGEISFGSTARIIPSSIGVSIAGAEHGRLVELEPDRVADVRAAALEDVAEAEAVGRLLGRVVDLVREHARADRGQRDVLELAALAGQLLDSRPGARRPRRCAPCRRGSRRG